MSKPNIILILLDGARWDRLPISRELVELQKDGTLFTNVTTVAPYTFASINVIFTGLYGKENGVDAYYKMFRLKNSVEFLPEVLQNNGYFTVCDLISDKVISSRGFDIYQFHDEYVDDLALRHPEFIKKIFNDTKDKPIFCFLQFSRIHTVTVSEVLKKYGWDNQEFYDRRDENLETYDRVFQESGRYAKKIYETINELGKLKNTILIFFSDHGTGVGERFGERNYGVFTYEETIRTFYLFVGPNIVKNVVSSTLLSTIDVFPTLLELCGISYKSKLPGQSFALDLFSNNIKPVEEKFVFSETGGLQGPFPSPKEPNVFCIKTNQYKLIFFKTPNEWRLYNLHDDPLETINLSGKGLDIEKILKEKLLNWINR